MEITTIGIDLAKSVFAVSCADDHGKVVLRKTLRRAQVLQFLRQKPCSLVGMEASAARIIGRVRSARSGIRCG
jgi:transposase